MSLCLNLISVVIYGERKMWTHHVRHKYDLAVRMISKWRVQSPPYQIKKIHMDRAESSFDVIRAAL